MGEDKQAKHDKYNMYIHEIKLYYDIKMTYLIVLCMYISVWRSQGDTNKPNMTSTACT